jgi:hypothetical protein
MIGKAYTIGADTYTKASWLPVELPMLEELFKYNENKLRNEQQLNNKRVEFYGQM